MDEAVKVGWQAQRERIPAEGQEEERRRRNEEFDERVGTNGGWDGRTCCRKRA
jgi:hypothetical protein